MLWSMGSQNVRHNLTRRKVLCGKLRISDEAFSDAAMFTEQVSRFENTVSIEILRITNNSILLLCSFPPTPIL